MEEKILKQFKTSCPFPLLIYRTVIRYNEVRKASGVAYILLEMIEKSVNSMDNIVDVLLRFGIPADLHHIFANEIAGLINNGIIRSSYTPDVFLNPKYFGQIRMGEVVLTEKGKKMFREGAIPTGAEKAKEKNIFFDPVSRTFDVVHNASYSDIETTGLDGKLADSVEIDISGMGDYINANSTKMGIKPEDRIVSFKSDDPQWKGTRKEDGLTVTVKNSGVEFVFGTSDENAFFNRYYSSETVKNVLILKKKYKFYDGDGNAVSCPTVSVDTLDGANIYIPDDIGKQVDRPCKIFACKSTLSYSRKTGAIKADKAASEKLLALLDKNAEFALLDGGGCRYYRALNVTMPCAQLKDVFEMQLLVENVATDEQLNKALKKLYEIYGALPFDEDNGKVILYVVDALNDTSLLEKYATSKLGEVKTADEKIAVLLRLNKAFKRTLEWKPLFDKLAGALYEASVKEVKLDNIRYKSTVLAPLCTEIGMSDMDYISSFAGGVKKTSAPAAVYRALEEAGFDIMLILGVVNFVEVLMRAVLSGESIPTDTDLATKFNTVKVNLWKLNEMLGIEDISSYTLRDDYNVDEFFNAYSTFTSACKAVERYRQYALKEFAELGRYSEIFEPVHDILSIERAAIAHPEKITEKYIDEHIARGKYKDAVCDLLIKLQFDLRSMLKLDKTAHANELIDEAKKEGILTGKQADALHLLRLCRNDFQHPETSRKTAFNGETIIEWKKLVFSVLRGDK